MALALEKRKTLENQKIKKILKAQSSRGKSIHPEHDIVLCVSNMQTMASSIFIFFYMVFYFHLVNV